MPVPMTKGNNNTDPEREIALLSHRNGRGMSAMSRDESAKCSDTAADLASKLAALPEMATVDLRAEWRRLHRALPPQRIGRRLLELGVAWKLQERAYGGFSAAMKRRLADLGKTMDENGDLAKPRTVKLKPGMKLVREWRGQTHDVLVLGDGFQWRGQRWRSLSAIAREISGTHWSGPRFFGLYAKAEVAGKAGSEAAAAKTNDA